MGNLKFLPVAVLLALTAMPSAQAAAQPIITYIDSNSENPVDYDPYLASDGVGSYYPGDDADGIGGKIYNSNNTVNFTGDRGDPDLAADSYNANLYGGGDNTTGAIGDASSQNNILNVGGAKDASGALADATVYGHDGSPLYIIGAFAKTDGTNNATAIGNTLNLGGETVKATLNSNNGAFIRGGSAETESGTANASGNQVNISNVNLDALKSSSTIIGGYAAATSENGITIAGEEKTQNVVVVDSEINKKDVGLYIYGSFATDYSEVPSFGNHTAYGQVYVHKNVSSNRGIYGARVSGAIATATGTVNIEPDNEALSIDVEGIYGVQADGDTAATANGFVNINPESGSVSVDASDFYGAYASSDTATAEATGTININPESGSVSVNASDFYGAYANSKTATATGTININPVNNGTTIVLDDFSGAKAITVDGTATAIGHVNVSNATFESQREGVISGGFAEAEKGAPLSVVAKESSLSFENVTLKNENDSQAILLLGGHATNGVPEDVSAIVKANENSVTLKDVTFVNFGDETNSYATVIGGYANTSSSGGNYEALQAINNTINLSGNGVSGFEQGVALFGGSVVTKGMDGQAVFTYIKDTSRYSFEGNTLNVNLNRAATLDADDKATGHVLREMGNVQNYNFTVNADTVENGDTILKVAKFNENDTLGGNVYFTNGLEKGEDGYMASQIQSINSEGGKVLEPGLELTLIDADFMHGEIASYETTGTSDVVTGTSGAFITYEWDLEQTFEGEAVGDGSAGTVRTRLRGVETTGEEVTLSLGHAGLLAILNSGGTDGTQALEIAINQNGNEHPSTGDSSTIFKPFFTFGGAKLDYGNDLQIGAVNFLGGAVGNWERNGGDLTFGAYLEGGDGSYDTRWHQNSASAFGTGDVDYFGGGLLGRFDFNSGLYAEATFRFGRISDDFISDITDAVGVRSGYDVTSTYYGAHAALGYKWATSQQGTMDIYGKYIWAHVNDASVRLSTGEDVKFDAMDSHRWQVGGRYSHEIVTSGGMEVTPYIGAIYEYESDGESSGHFNVFNFDSDVLSGSTGIVEVGLDFKPNPKSSFTYGVDVEGNFGARQGVAGTMHVSWEF